MLLNCGVGEDSWESLGLQGDPTSPSILKEISPECSLKGLMLKLKLQYFGHLMWRTDSFEKTLMLGNIEGRQGRGREDAIVGWHHWFNDMTLSKLQEFMADREAWHATESMGWQRVRHNWVTELIELTRRNHGPLPLASNYIGTHMHTHTLMRPLRTTVISVKGHEGTLLFWKMVWSEIKGDRSKGHARYRNSLCKYLERRGFGIFQVCTMKLTLNAFMVNMFTLNVSSRSAWHWSGDVSQLPFGSFLYHVNEI